MENMKINVNIFKNIWNMKIDGTIYKYITYI